MRNNENIISEIEILETIPFRLIDLFTIPAFILLGFFFLIMLNPEKESEQTYYQLYYAFILPLTILIILFLTLGRILIRRHTLKSVKYVLTNQRILFLDKKINNIVKAYELNKIEIDYTENISNIGSIIIIVPKPKEYIEPLYLIEFLFTSKMDGIPLSENKNVIHNIKDVRLVFKKIIEMQKNIV